MNDYGEQNVLKCILKKTSKCVLHKFYVNWHLKMRWMLEMTTVSEKWKAEVRALPLWIWWRVSMRFSLFSIRLNVAYISFSKMFWVEPNVIASNRWTITILKLTISTEVFNAKKAWNKIQSRTKVSIIQTKRFLSPFEIKILQMPSCLYPLAYVLPLPTSVIIVSTFGLNTQNLIVGFNVSLAFYLSPFFLNNEFIVYERFANGIEITCNWWLKEGETVSSKTLNYNNSNNKRHINRNDKVPLSIV